MERSPDATTAEEQSTSPKKAKAPLWQRMYFRREMTEIVRLMGYDEIPLDEARERLRPLLVEYGKERIEEGAAELLTIDVTRTHATARLSDEARALAIQILGRPKQEVGAVPSAAAPAQTRQEATPDAPSRDSPKAQPSDATAESKAGDASTDSGAGDSSRPTPKKRKSKKRGGAAL